MLNMKSQISITGKLGEKNPINRMPKAHKTLARAACLLEHRKNKIAETKITKRPGISRGNSSNPLCKSLIKKVSCRKLFKVESTMLCEKPKTNVAAKNSRRSLGISDSLLFARVIIILTFHKFQ